MVKIMDGKNNIMMKWSFAVVQTEFPLVCVKQLYQRWETWQQSKDMSTLTSIWRSSRGEVQAAAAQNATGYVFGSTCKPKYLELRILGSDSR